MPTFNQQMCCCTLEAVTQLSLDWYASAQRQVTALQSSDWRTKTKNARYCPKATANASTWLQGQAQAKEIRQTNESQCWHDWNTDDCLRAIKKTCTYSSQSTRSKVRRNGLKLSLSSVGNSNIKVRWEALILNNKYMHPQLRIKCCSWVNNVDFEE